MYFYADMFNAFDTINQNIMLQKLLHVGVRWRVFDWFRTYLADREQDVAVDGMFSTLKVIGFGIPWGLNLGPLLFFIIFKR